MGNHYQRKQRHKWMQKQRHAVDFNTFDPWLDEQQRREFCAPDDVWFSNWLRSLREKNGGYHYWRHNYVSGRKGFAKELTNRVIRRAYANSIAAGDYEDIVADRGAAYQKRCDYWWIVW